MTVKGQEILAKILQVIPSAKSELCCLKGWRDEFNKCFVFSITAEFFVFN